MVLFEGGHMLAHRRLGEKKLPGRLPEGSFLDDGAEDSQLMEVHIDLPPLV